MKIITTLIFLFIALNFSKAQGSYIIRDSIADYGVQVIKQGVSRHLFSVRVRIEGEIKVLGIDELLEFGLKNGQVFVRKEVNINGTKVLAFLERISLGRISFYQLHYKSRNRFFLERNSEGLIEISRQRPDEFKSILRELMIGCPIASNNIDLVTFQIERIKRLLYLYDNCENGFMPYGQFGASIGFARISAEPTSAIEQRYTGIEFNSSISPSIGVNGEFPILASQFSLDLSAVYTSGKFSFQEISNNTEIIVESRISSISIPLLAKFTAHKKKLSPYLSAGLVMFYNSESSNSIIADINGSTILIQEQARPSLFDKTEFGYKISFGVTRKLNLRQRLFLEVNYQKTAGNLDFMGRSLLSFNTGIKF